MFINANSFASAVSRFKGVGANAVELVCVFVAALCFSARSTVADAPCGMNDNACVDLRFHAGGTGAPFTLTWNEENLDYESGSCSWAGHDVYAYLYAVRDVTVVQEYPTVQYQIDVYWELDVYFDGTDPEDLEDYWYDDDTWMNTGGDDNYADFSYFACQFLWDNWDAGARPSYPTDDGGAAAAAFYDDNFGTNGEGNNDILDLYWGTTTEHDTPAVN